MKAAVEMDVTIRIEVYLNQASEDDKALAQEMTDDLKDDPSYQEAYNASLGRVMASRIVNDVAEKNGFHVDQSTMVDVELNAILNWPFVAVSGFYNDDVIAGARGFSSVEDFQAFCANVPEPKPSDWPFHVPDYQVTLFRAEDIAEPMDWEKAVAWKFSDEEPVKGIQEDVRALVDSAFNIQEEE